MVSQLCGPRIGVVKFGFFDDELTVMGRMGQRKMKEVRNS
jgi:hypothetical protein